MLKELVIHKQFSHTYNKTIFHVQIELENGLHQSLSFTPEQAGEAFERLAKHFRDLNAQTPS